MDEYYSIKRIYVVIDRQGQIVSTLEQPIRLAKDWKQYLHKELCENAKALPEKSKEESDFIAKWAEKKEYDIIVGIADSLGSFISSIPEFSKRRGDIAVY